MLEHTVHGVAAIDAGAADPLLQVCGTQRCNKPGDGSCLGRRLKISKQCAVFQWQFGCLRGTDLHSRGVSVKHIQRSFANSWHNRCRYQIIELMSCVGAAFACTWIHHTLTYLCVTIPGHCSICCPGDFIVLSPKRCPILRSPTRLKHD